MGATAQAAAREVPRLEKERPIPGRTSGDSLQSLPPSGSGPQGSSGLHLSPSALGEGQWLFPSRFGVVAAGG